MAPCDCFLGYILGTGLVVDLLPEVTIVPEMYPHGSRGPFGSDG